MYASGLVGPAPFCRLLKAIQNCSENKFKSMFYLLMWIILMCLLSLEFWVNILLQYLHSNSNFFLCWCCTCISKLYLVLKLSLQCFTYFLWIVLLWPLKLKFCVRIFGQYWHLNSAFFLCWFCMCKFKLSLQCFIYFLWTDLMCRLRLELCVKIWGHISHLYSAFLLCWFWTCTWKLYLVFNTMLHSMY